MTTHLLQHLKYPDRPLSKTVWPTMPLAGISLALSEALATHQQPMLLLVPDPLIANQLSRSLPFFNPKLAETIHYFPDWETLPYDHFSPHQDIISERLTLLNRLPQLTAGALITTPATLMHRLPPPSFLDQHSFLVNCHDHLNLDQLKTRLIRAGYHCVSEVREHGEYAIRGSLIDIFPMGSSSPFRIDLLDEEVESIRLFSPETQRSTEAVNAIHLLPAKEFPLSEDAIDHFRKQWRTYFPGNPLHSPLYQDISEGICSPGIEYYLPLFFEKTATLFDYLPSSTIILTLGETLPVSNEFWGDILTRYEQTRYDLSRPLLPPETVFLTPETIQTRLADYQQIKVRPQTPDALKEIIQASTFPPSESRQHDVLASLKHFLSGDNGRILFCTETIGRRELLLQALKSIDIHPTTFSDWNAFLESPQSRYGIVVTQLEEGFTLLEEKITLFTEQQLYPHRIMQRRLRKLSAQDPNKVIRDLNELQLNEAVVHIDHGIGRYRGLQRITVGDQENEFLMLEYQQEAKLYVPISSLHLISRYTGSDPDHIPINKLGTDQWQRAKKKAAEKIRDIAAELLELYAERAAKPGHVYQLPEEAYANFCAEFPFEETPDQLQVIEQVFADMQSDKSMDRVVCGDVGFGKTEVALRAAFLAVHNSKQVVLLVPTTLLAQQHYDHFQNRFAEWPVKVELLSRFKTAKDQKIILPQLEAGAIDIIIGTHKLLQKDIKFKSLGLVIIDEEHRFGVKQKEILKSMRANVDMLTLTATPIPRTLNMTLSGIRDLSIIATPPARRLAVKTFVHEYQDSILQEAVLREILRGGQVYFLHNEVSSIEKKAEEIRSLVKEARVGVAHGQMHERELERMMASFYHRQINVLVCSTIIESGIDIPTANTIIINRADKLGLAQLHQLRGRVGRSHHQAYAYLLTPPKSLLTEDAKKRLDAIGSLDKLGIGFSLASLDLEIRGAGELLGDEQSGNMHEIGFTLYMELLSRAVEDLKQGKSISAISIDMQALSSHAEIDLHIPALIPDDYLGDVQLRLSLYKRIASAETEENLEAIQIEMIDRFGLLPEQAKSLFSIAILKQKANQLGIQKLDANEHGGKIEFNEKMTISPERIISLLQTKHGKYKLHGGNQLRFSLLKHERHQRVEKVNEVLMELSG